MAGDNKEIMNEDDIALLVNSFPDLQEEKGFPKEPTSASVVDFMSGYMEKLGLEGSPSEMLEYLAVVTTMKAAAQLSLGELDGNAYKLLCCTSAREKAFSKVIAEDLNDCKDKIHPDVRQSIANVDFKTVAAMYPMQNFMHKNVEMAYEPLFEVGDFEAINKVAALPMLGGNETGRNNAGQENLVPGEFGRTAECRIETSIKGKLFEGYASQHLLFNALQVRAALELGEQFPQMGELIKENKEFFRSHAPETLAVCHALKEGNQKVNNFETLQEMIAAEETKKFAYNNYVPVFEAFCHQIDTQKGKCSLTYGDRENPGEVSMPRNLSQAEKGGAFAEEIQKQAKEQAAKTIGCNASLKTKNTRSVNE